MTGHPLRVLIVEDSESDASLIARALGQAGYDVQSQRVELAGEMQAALDGQAWDVVIADFQLPQFDAPAALGLLQHTGLDIPFLVVSGTIGESTAVAMMKSGAHDYLLKDNLSRLAPAVEREIREAQSRRERMQAEGALRQSEERYRLLTASILDVIWILDLETAHFRYISPSVERLRGYSAEEALQQDMTASLTPRSAKEVLDALPSRIRDFREGRGSSYVDEVEQPCRDGSTVWTEVTTHYRLNEESGHIEVFGVSRNITERKQAQERTLRHLQRLNALRNIDMTIAASLDLRLTLNSLVEQVMTELEVDATDILLLNATSHMLAFAAGRGFRTAALQHTRLRLGDGYAGRAALERRIVHIPNLPSAPGDLARSKLFAEEGFQGYFAAPLVVKGEARGVLEVFQRGSLAPDEEWVSFLEMVASQAAIAIDNLELFDGVQRSNLELAMAYDSTLEGWSYALDLRDKETEGHTQRVTEMTLQLAGALGMEESALIHVRRGALLHDIGKMGIPDSILLKPGPLTDAEWIVMRKHPEYAHEMLLPIKYLHPALDIPYCHHEKWDGTGYPRGLKGEEIPLSARMFAVVDVWDALLSDRPYRPRWTKEKALEHIDAESGKHFDPHVVESFRLILQGS